MAEDPTGKPDGATLQRGQPDRSASHPLRFDVRFLVQAEHDRFRVSDESHALAWVPAVGLDALTNEESVLRMTRKWVVRRGDGDS